jgi:hypothetical protein
VSSSIASSPGHGDCICFIVIGTGFDSAAQSGNSADKIFLQRQTFGRNGGKPTRGERSEIVQRRSILR